MVHFSSVNSYLQKPSFSIWRCKIDTSLITFNSAITDLVRQVKGERSKRIYKYDALTFSKWIDEMGYQISNLTRSHFLAYKEWLEENYEKATAARMLSVARRLLDEAVLHNILPANPGKEVKGISVSNESPHIALEKQEAKSFLEVIDTKSTQGKRDYALVSLLLRTGIRRTECASLTIGDIQIEQGHHIATIQHGKGDKRRKVKIPVDVFRAIEEYIKASERTNAPLKEPLFCGFLRNGKPSNKGISDKRIEQIVMQYGDKALSKKITPHDLRASFITLAIEGGATLTQTQYAAGHSDPRTTERYHIRKTNLDDNAVDYIKF